MFPKRFVLGSLSGAMAFLFMTSSWAADLAEIKQRGEIRHIGIRYANFVTGAGDGLACLIRKRRPRGWRAWCKALIRRRIRL